MQLIASICDLLKPRLLGSWKSMPSNLVGYGMWCTISSWTYLPSPMDITICELPTNRDHDCMNWCPWLWEWSMILTLCAQLIYVNVLHWIVVLYHYGVLVNVGIGLILVIQSFCLSTLSVLYNMDVYPTSSMLLFPMLFSFIDIKI